MDERLTELARQVRGRSLVDPIFDEEYRAYEQQETVERVLVSTSQGQVPVFLHRANRRTSPCRLLINIHGGGFVRPLIETNVRFCSKMAVELQGMVVDIDYSLAPEHPYPQAFHECYEVVRWVFDHKSSFDTREDLIALGGHSAGSNLTAALLLKASQTGDFQPRLQIHDFGAFDMATDPADKPGIEENLVPLDRCRAFNEMYIWPNPEVARDPYVSPLFAPDNWLIGQPDALIITGGTDTFRFEGEQYGLRLAAAGVRVTMQRFPNSPHGFTINCVGKWREAQQLILDTLLRMEPGETPV